MPEIFSNTTLTVNQLIVNGIFSPQYIGKCFLLLYHILIKPQGLQSNQLSFSPN